MISFAHKFVPAKAREFCASSDVRLSAVAALYECWRKIVCIYRWEEKENAGRIRGVNGQYGVVTAVLAESALILVTLHYQNFRVHSVKF